MTEAEARARLERMIAPDMDPTLSTADVDDLIAIAKRPAPDGVVPSDAQWTPTWDLNAAARMGWEIKAGRAAASFDFGEDSQRFNRSQVHDACMAMARLYSTARGSVVVSSTTTPAPLP